MRYLERIRDIYTRICDFAAHDAVQKETIEDYGALSVELSQAVRQKLLQDDELQAILPYIRLINVLANAAIRIGVITNSGQADMERRVLDCLTGIKDDSARDSKQQVSSPNDDQVDYDPWRAWFTDHISHPYYSNKERDSLLKMVPNMTPQKMQTWFVNVRRRSGWSELYKNHAQNKRDVMEAIFKACEEDENEGKDSDANVPEDARRLVKKVKEYLTLESKKTQLQPWLIDLVDRYKERMAVKQAKQLAIIDSSATSPEASASSLSPLTPLSSTSPSPGPLSPAYTPCTSASRPSNSLALQSSSPPSSTTAVLATKDRNQSTANKKRKAGSKEDNTPSTKKQKPSLYTNKHPLPASTRSSASTSTASAVHPLPSSSSSTPSFTPSFSHEGPSVFSTRTKAQGEGQKEGEQSFTSSSVNHQGSSELTSIAAQTRYQHQSSLEPCTFFYDSPASSFSVSGDTDASPPPHPDYSSSYTPSASYMQQLTGGIATLGFEVQPLALAQIQVPLQPHFHSYSHSASLPAHQYVQAPVFAASPGEIDNAGFTYETSFNPAAGSVFQQQVLPLPSSHAQAWTAPSLVYGQMQPQPTVLETVPGMTGLGIQMTRQ